MNRSRSEIQIISVLSERILEGCKNWYGEQYTSVIILGTRKYWWSCHYILRLKSSSGTSARDILVKVSLPPDAHQGRQHGVRPAAQASAREFDALSMIYQSVSDSECHDLTAIRPLACYPDLNALVLEYVPGQNLLSLITKGFHRSPPVCRRGQLDGLLRNVGRLLATIHRVDNGKYLHTACFDLAEYIASWRRTIDLLFSSVRTQEARNRLEITTNLLILNQRSHGLHVTVSRLHKDFYPDNIVLLPTGKIYVVDTTLDQEGPIEEDIAKFIIGAWVTKKALLLRHGWLSDAAQTKISNSVLDGYAAVGTVNRDVLFLSVLQVLLRRWLEVQGVLMEQVSHTLAGVALRSRIEPAFIRCLDNITLRIQGKSR